MKRILYDILILILIAILCFSGWHLFTIFRSYHQGTSAYDKIRRETVSAASSDSRTETPAQDSSVPDRVPITVNWSKLRSINSQVAGYIYDEGTKINYPVLQGTDNEQYLHHLMDGTYNSSGSIFMDSSARSDLSCRRTILYGHHMKNGSMFAALHQYRDPDFYREHPYMWYLTPSQNYRLDLIAGYVIDPDDAVYQQDFQNQSELDQFLASARSRSDFTALDPHTEDTPEHVLILSTCAYEYEDARYIVVCVPVPVD